MKNIIVTGGLGHIGSKLVRTLLENQYKVTCFDNLSTQRISSLRGLVTNKNFTFKEIDVSSERKNILSSLEEENYSALIHLAAVTNAEASLEDPKRFFKNNLNGTKLALEICSEKGARLIFPSSTSIYGTSESSVDEENNKYINPQSPYAECKVEEEALIQESALEDSVILRLGTIFGVSPGMRFHTAVNKFCWQAVMQLPITVWKTALHQHRPYLEINDACRAILFFLIKDTAKPSIYNVNTSNFTVSEIIENIKMYINNIDIEFVESKIMNQLSYHVLNQKLIDLGFKFEGSLDKGISDTINWFKKE